MYRNNVKVSGTYDQVPKVSMYLILNHPLLVIKIFVKAPKEKAP